MKKHWKKILVAVVLVAGVVGWLDTILTHNNSAHLAGLVYRKCVGTIPIKGADEGCEARIREAISVFPQTVLNSVVKITVTGDEREFDGESNTANCRYRCIWLRRNGWTVEDLRHEIIHVFVSTLPREAMEEWEKNAQFSYRGEDNWDTSENRRVGYPRYGVLTLYGSSSPDEDMAEWGALIYTHLDGHSRYLNYIKDKSDLRYNWKPGWFLKWGMITPHSYHVIKLVLS